MPMSDFSSQSVLETNIYFMHKSIVSMKNSSDIASVTSPKDRRHSRYGFASAPQSGARSRGDDKGADIRHRRNTRTILRHRFLNGDFSNHLTKGLENRKQKRRVASDRKWLSVFVFLLVYNPLAFSCAL